MVKKIKSKIPRSCPKSIKTILNQSILNQLIPKLHLPRTKRTLKIKDSNSKDRDRDINNKSEDNNNVVSVKCVIVGDANTGKTSLIHSFLFDDFSVDYVPTTRDDYTLCTTLNVMRHGYKVNVDLDICDTGGQNYLDRLRPLCYSKTDVILLCFSVIDPASFRSVKRRWTSEIRRHCLKNVKIILVGTQSDLRSNVNILLQLIADGLSPIPEARALRLAKKIGAINYFECSSLTHYNVKRLFESAMISCIRKDDDSDNCKVRKIF